MSSRFLQIHTLTHYPASLLNRDDAGFAKRMPFGGAIRTRISSQCLKRHWRTFDGEDGLAALAESEALPDSVRSREIFKIQVLPGVVKTPGISEMRARWAVASMVALLQVGTKANQKAKAKRASVAKKFVGTPEAEAPKAPRRREAAKAGDAEEAEETTAEDVLSQVVVLGPPEIAFLTSEAIALARTDSKDEDLVEEARARATNEQKANLEALAASVTKGAGLSAALFGRMRTGDLFADTEAAIHVAHALTVHGQMAETDYFTAIDELVREEGEAASGHINASELTSGLYYGYVVVDVNGLVNNLGGERKLAGQVADRLVHIISKVSPGAKKGSTAPYAYSHLVLVESGDAQPRTLQNAFIEPVRSSGDLIQNTYRALRRHLAELDAMYGKSEIRAHAGLHTVDESGGSYLELFENRMSIPVLSSWTAGQIEA